MNTSVLRSAFRAATAVSQGSRLIVKRQHAAICSFSSHVSEPETNESLTRKWWTKFDIPPQLKEKLGINYKCNVAARRHPQLLTGSNLPERASILEQFERNCAASTHVGIACYVDAILRNMQPLPLGSEDSVRFQSAAPFSKRSYFGHRVNTQTSGPDKYTILQTISKCRLFVHALPKLESLATATPTELEIKIYDELEYMAEIFAMVVQRFCTEMTFHSLEEVLSTLGEALLRVVQFRTPVLSIDNVTLYTGFEGDDDAPVVLYKSVARWKSATQHSSIDQPGSREVEVVVEQRSRDDPESELDEGLERDESAEDLEPAIATKNELLPRTEASTAAFERVVDLLKPSLGKADKLTLVVVRPLSANLNSRFGLHLKSIKFVWDRDHVDALEALTRADLIRFIRTTCLAAVGENLSLACQVTKTIANETLGSPAVLLEFSSRDGDTAPPGIREIHMRSLQLIARATSGGMPSISITFAGTPWSISQSSVLAPQQQRLRLDYKLMVSRLHEPGCASAGDGIDAIRHIRKVVEAQIAPHTELKPADTLQKLVQRCGDAILQLQQPLAGLVYFSRVRVGVSAYDAGGFLVERGVGDFINASEVQSEEGEKKDESVQDDVFIALGSNIGNRLAAIEQACQSIDEDPDMKVVATSELFETEPMYVEDQGRFLNGVCQIETSLKPIDLLDRLQGIENGLGRVKLIDKGPRNIDLDIVAYGQRQLNTDRLVIPHRLMLEREFVLRPLATIAPEFVHPVTHKPVHEHLLDLPEPATLMYALTSLAPALEPVRYQDPAQETFIMAILNVTPDSFSDGGDNSPANQKALQATVASHIVNGATIIDIGGQSSRPNAPDISAEEEIARILPAIEAIKSLPEASKVAISVDTYRASVAEAAVNAGAHIINDISAGLLDPEMLPTIARLGCTYIMMHMRGTPHTMQNEENTSYPGGVAETVVAELAQRLDAAQAAGIRRWRIIMDPGVGFAKTTEQNVEILRDMEKIRGDPRMRSLPWLVGTSRKGFIGKITGVEKASERMAGTAATVTAAVAGGASIVRVHDVKEMTRVVKMADAIYKKSTAHSPLK